MRQTIEQRMAAAQVASDFLRDEAEKLKTKLEASEEKLQKYKEEQNAVSLQEDQNITVARLKELNVQVGEAKNQRIKLESDMDLLRKMPETRHRSNAADPECERHPAGPGSSCPDRHGGGQFGGDPEALLTAASQTIQAITQLEQLRRLFSDTLRNAGEILEPSTKRRSMRKQKLNEALKEQEQDALELNKIAIPYNVLQREVDSDRAMYDAVNARLRETNVSLGVEIKSLPRCPGAVDGQAGATPVAENGSASAYFSDSPSVPEPSLVWICSIAACVTSIRRRAFLSFRFSPSSRTSRGQRGDKIPSVFPDASQSQQAEAFRSMRTTLSLLGDEAHRRSFLVTSAIPGEGKTFCAYNAAMAFAAEGQKTILVDADLRMPAVHKIFSDAEGARRHAGLSDYLAGDVEIDRIIMAGPQENLSVICAGGKTSNPGELLGADGFATLMKTLAERFDRVIIDSAPVNAVSDTLRITPLANYVCLVVRAAKTPKKALARAKKLIENAKGKLAGFILNRVHLGRDSAYYFYHYAYGSSDAKAVSGLEEEF